ncbi:transmembrane adaptor Erv26 [Naviculisporaceae sp. PSN 640]
MWILPLVGYLGSIVGFCFLTLAIASGLYYLSELVEEHTVIAKKVLTKLIYGIIALQLVLVVVDGFPILPTLLGIFSHVIYLGNMRRFPYVKLSDPLFVASCALVLINHYVWFKHFSHHQERAYQNMSSYYDAPSNMPTFTEIASYFGICVWLVPFALFVSLSASDNVLPTMGHEGTMSAGGVDADTKKRRGQGMAKALVDGVLNTIGEISAMSKFKRNDRDRL